MFLNVLGILLLLDYIALCYSGVDKQSTKVRKLALRYKSIFLCFSTYRTILFCYQSCFEAKNGNSLLAISNRCGSVHSCAGTQFQGHPPHFSVRFSKTKFLSESQSQNTTEYLTLHCCDQLHALTFTERKQGKQNILPLHPDKVIVNWKTAC